MQHDYKTLYVRLSTLRATVKPGIAPSAYWDIIRLSDTSLADLLQSENYDPRKGLFLDIYAPNDDLSNIKNPASLIARFLLCNLSHRIRSDFGAYLADAKFTSRITGRVNLQAFGRFSNDSHSKSERIRIDQAGRDALLAKGFCIQDCGETHSWRYRFPYEENHVQFEQYTAQLGGKSEFRVKNGYIKDWFLSLDPNQLPLWSPPSQDDAPVTDVLTQAQAEKIEECAMQMQNLLPHAQQTGDKLDQTRMGLLESYMAEIQRHMGYQGQIRQAMDARYQTVRERYQTAMDSMDREGRIRTDANRGNLRQLWMLTESAINRHVRPMALYISDLQCSGVLLSGIIHPSGISTHRQDMPLDASYSDRDGCYEIRMSQDNILAIQAHMRLLLPHIRFHEITSENGLFRAMRFTDDCVHDLPAVTLAGQDDDEDDEDYE